MSLLFKKMSKTELAAVAAPAVMMFAVFALPAQSDNDTEPSSMPFDSVGAMLLDMDRERSVSEMESYASLPRLEARDSDYQCQTEDLNDRLQEVYAGLQARVAEIDLKEVKRLERQIEARQERNKRLALLSASVKRNEERREAHRAANRLRMTIETLQRQAAEAEMANDAVMTAAVEAALAAAEAALEPAN